MTDAERIDIARWLLGQALADLDSAASGLTLGAEDLREAGFLSAMGAAEAVLRVLGGTYFSLDNLRGQVA